MPWEKGQSGNPGGRPKGEAKMREAAQSHTERSIGVLAEALEDADARVRIRAAEVLLDRAYGKPAQAIVGDADNPVGLLIEWANRANTGGS